MFLAPGGVFYVEFDAGLAGQRGDDVSRGATAEGVKAVFVEGQAVGPRHGEPGPVVGRHGVGERAIAIEEDGVGGLEVPHGVGRLGRVVVGGW